ncbi:MAG: FG-GAP-like repeat-containing protein [Cyclobacteriaceae bacterium]
MGQLLRRCLPLSFLLIPLFANSQTKLNDVLTANHDVKFIRVSEDGTRVIYLEGHGSLLQPNELYTVPITGGSAVKLNGTLVAGGTVGVGTTPSLDHFKISQNSASVVYMADEDTDDVVELYSVPIAGGTPTKLNGGLVSGGNVIAFEISSDNNTVFYRADQDSDNVIELYSAPIGGGASTKLNQALVGDEDVTFFRVSPDLNTIVYSITDNGAANIYSVSSGGGSSTLLNDALLTNETINGFVISADNARVVYYLSNFIAMTHELFSVPIGGGTTVNLNGTLVAGGAVSLANPIPISPDGSTVVFAADKDTDEVVELYSVPITGGSQTKLNGIMASGGNVFNDFEIRADGARVIFRADQDIDEDYELYSVPIGGGVPDKLNDALTTDGDVGQFLVSPDGNNVVYYADQDTDQTFELYSVSSDGGGSPTKLNATLVSGGNVSANDFQVSQDNSTVVYLADQETDGVNELFAVPIGGGTTTKLNGALISGGAVLDDFLISSDGSQVVYRADQDTDNVFEVFSSSLTGPPGETVSESDSLALVALYNSTDGANWLDNTNWLQPAQNVGSWTGVAVDAGRVTQLDLNSNNLIGPIPAEIGDLTALTFLSLWTNNLSGSIPVELGNLTNLTFLSIQTNALTGTIPAELGNLNQLTVFSLHTNNLSGSIPTTLGNLTQLIQLLISNNQLTGSVPVELQNLTLLNDLFIGQNELSGSIPSELSNLTNVDDFNFEMTQLCEPSDGAYQTWKSGVITYDGTDVICDDIGVLQADSLALVDLYTSTNGGNWSNNTNWLQVDVPVNYWWGITASGGRVTEVRLNDDNDLDNESDGNGLIGTIPITIGDLNALVTLDLSGGFGLSGTIPTEIGNLSGLTKLTIFNQSLSGNIPSEIGNLTALQTLDFRVNQLSGSIPSEIGNLTSLSFLLLGRNQLTGSIPTEIQNLTSLGWFSVGNNQLSGIIPTGIGNLTGLFNLGLSNNQFTGAVPTTFQNLTGIDKLNISNNQLDALPDLSVLNPSQFDVNDNNFEFPELILNIADITTYDPQNNFGSEQVLSPTNGQNINLNANPEIDGDNTYQWFKDGIEISGATSLLYNIPSYSVADDGLYLLEITNPNVPGLTLTSATIAVGVQLPVTDPPADVTASLTSESGVAIRFQDANEDETGHIIQRSEGTPDSFTQIGTTGAIEKPVDFIDNRNYYATFFDTGLNPSTTYYYRVASEQSGIASTYSIIISITTPATPTPFERITTGPVVNDVLAARYAGHWGDIDGDLDPDLMTLGWAIEGSGCTICSRTEKSLFQNNGDGTFTKIFSGDITQDQFNGRAGAWGDMDNDGDLDYVEAPTNGGATLNGTNPLILYRNDDGTFTREILLQNTTFGGFENAALADFDNNGYLDLYSDGVIMFNQDGSNFIENQFMGTPNTIGPGVLAADFNDDGLVDLMIFGDAATELYENTDGSNFSLVGGLFTEVPGARALVAADFDNDGDLDIATGRNNSEDIPLTFYRNDGNFSFVLATQISAYETNRGLMTADVDNDGDEDLIAVNVRPTGVNTTGKSTIFYNNGTGDFSFTELSSVESTFTTANNTFQGGSIADFDNDGFQDIFISSGFVDADPVALYRNQATSGNNWIKLKLNSTVSAPDGVGAKVDITAGPITNHKQIMTTNGTWAGNEQVAHFGLGGQATADYTITWPSGHVQSATGVAANQFLELTEEGRFIDSLALVALYQSTDGANWTDNSNWLTGDINTWFGVTAGIAPNGRVTEIDFSAADNGLNGVLPDEIGNLTALQILNFRSNAISGSIPSTIGNLTNLTTINLGFTNINGSIPPEIGDLTNLENLFLLELQLTGSIPTTIGNLTNLQNLSLGANSVSTLTGTTYPLSGELPIEMGNLTNLNALTIGENSFTGPIPNELLALTNLSILSIQGNNFTSLPDFSSNGPFSVFSVSNNLFTYEDLEPNISVITDNTGQKPFGEAQIIEVEEGGSATLSFTVGGDNNTYQWRKNGTDVAGATTNTLELTNFVATDAGQYVLNAFNSVVDTVVASAPGGDLQLVSNAITVSLAAPTTVIASDSLALVALYDSLDGPNWINNTNWLQPNLNVGEWFGITIADERVTQIQLPNNGLVGKVGPGIISLAGLNKLDLSNNEVDSIPDLSSIETLDTLFVAGNRLEFDDLIPNASIDQLTVSPQANVGVELDTVVLATNNFNYQIEVRGTNNSYQWIFNGEPLEGQTTDNLQLTAATVPDEGDYLLQVTNEAVPGLTIASENLKILIRTLAQDRAVLTNLFNGLGGFEWTARAKWLSADSLKNWFGITADTLKVTGISLPANNLKGSLTEAMLDLPGLTTLNLSGNEILSIPQLELTITTANFVDNRLEFGSIEPNLGHDGFTFIPQNEVLEENDILVELGESATIDRTVTGTANTYTWFRDGAVVNSETGPTLTLDNIQIEDESSFNVQVNNDLVEGLTLSSTFFELKVSSLVRDSLALVAIYNAMGGENWTNSANWLAGPLSTWAGVTIENNRVTGLNLSNNNLIGPVPTAIRDIASLTTLDLSNNDITRFPNVSRLTGLTTLDITGNELGFGDFEPNLNITNFDFEIQREFGALFNGRFPVGSDFDTTIVISGTQNQYQWFKRRRRAPLETVTPVLGATSPELIIEELNFETMGVYHLEVTSPLFPDVVVRSQPLRLFAITDIFGTAFIDPVAGIPMDDGDVITFEISRPGEAFAPFDTVSVDLQGKFRIPDVILGDFIIVGRPGDSFGDDVIQTYYKSINDWALADTVFLRNSVDGIDIDMIDIPPPFIDDPNNPDFNDALIGGFFEVDIPEDFLDGPGGRILAARRVRRAGVSLNRARAKQRPLQEVEFVLVAYAETDENGRFSFENVPPGDYRLNIQFPGLPMDPNSFIEYTIDPNMEQQVIEVAALGTPEGGIQVTEVEVAGFYRKYFKGLKVYPNPTSDYLEISYEKLNAAEVVVKLVDLGGNEVKMWELPKTSKANLRVNLTNVSKGVYLLNFVEEQSNGINVVTYQLIVN